MKKYITWFCEHCKKMNTLTYDTEDSTWQVCVNLVAEDHMNKSLQCHYEHGDNVRIVTENTFKVIDEMERKLGIK